MSRFVQRDAVGPVPAAGEVARPGGDAPLQAVRPASGLIAGGEPLQRPSAAAGSIRRSAAVADPLGGSEVAGDVESALASTRGGGRPLPPDVASSMGSAMGADLSGVRVHDNARADQLSRSVQAVAFTQGSNVYFSSGSYSPSTSSGQHLLAHELAHVVEGPSGGSGGALSRSTVGRADDPAEAAADRVADQTLAALRRTTAPATSVIDPNTLDCMNPAVGTITSQAPSPGRFAAKVARTRARTSPWSRSRVRIRPHMSKRSRCSRRSPRMPEVPPRSTDHSAPVIAEGWSCFLRKCGGQCVAVAQVSVPRARSSHGSPATRAASCASAPVNPPLG